MIFVFHLSSVKYLFSFLVFFTIQFTGFSQSMAEYGHAMERFSCFFNNDQEDSIDKMFFFRKTGYNVSSQSHQFHVKYGDLKSYKYMTTDATSGLLYFKTEFSKISQTKATGILLNEENKIYNFVLMDKNFDSIINKH